MSKKRGPNSPMESEKTKQSTSAAASTLGMASMLSVMSSVFNNNQAASVVTDSEDEYSQANENENENPWEEANVNKSKIRQPKEDGRTTEPELKPLFNYVQDGAMRDEIEVEILTKNNRKFTGSVTPLEAKYDIYIKALQFENHDNFDGVRINYKGKLVVTFKLIQPINIDELDAYERFEFKRSSTVNGKKVEDVIGCKIKGIRYRQPTVSEFDNVKQDDGERLVKIEGCEYRVSEDEILAWLSLYGEVKSELREDCFRDENQSTGHNRTGNYSILVKLEREIPQLLPMQGRRIKMYHAGIQKLCTHCFGPHKKQHCTVENKVPFIDYVRNFIEDNQDIPVEFFGRWAELVDKVNIESATGKSRRNSGNQGRQEEQPRASNYEKTSGPDSQPEVRPVAETSSNSNQRSNGNQTEAKQTDPNEQKGPTKEEFDIPTSVEAYELMVERLATVGLAKWEVDKAIEAKTTAYNRACREFKKNSNQVDSKAARVTRKNSFRKMTEK
jgi:hypothetical protein